jgi:hypothetical protein
VLRWLEGFNLVLLERLVLRSRSLQRFVLDRHERALRKLLVDQPPIEQVGIVGGGLFPRTALILQRLLPGARLFLIDANPDHLAIARTLIQGNVEFIHGWYDPSTHRGYDLLVVPLAFVGDRAALYRQPPAPVVLIHDWIWNRVGAGTIVSPLLLKRLNKVCS